MREFSAKNTRKIQIPTITISQQFGSHWDTVAQLVCEQLGYRYFDKNLMTGLATQTGYSLKVAHRLPDWER